MSKEEDMTGVYEKFRSELLDSCVPEPPCKGHTYKGPFHVMRMLAKCMTLLEQ